MKLRWCEDKNSCKGDANTAIPLSQRAGYGKKWKDCHAHLHEVYSIRTGAYLG